MILLLIKIHSIPEKRTELLQTLRLLEEGTRGSPGCLGHEWYQSAEQPDVLVLFEQWETREHLRRHHRSEIFRVFAGAVRTLTDRLEAKSYSVRKAASGPPLCPGDGGLKAV